jgi:hypothetical protein
LDQIYLNLEIEKLHIKFNKCILGVNKRATNFATFSELGRFPLHFDIIKSMIRYWYRLENLDSNFTLLKDVNSRPRSVFKDQEAVKCLGKTLNSFLVFKYRPRSTINIF